jgi:hypothetical protein
MKFCLAVAALFLLSVQLSAQTVRPKGSFQFHIGLPIIIGNQAFKGMMQGLVSGTAHYQYTLKNSMSFGVGVNYDYFTINEFKIPEKRFGGMHAPVAFIKFGQEKFYSSSFGTDFSVKAGYGVNVLNSKGVAGQPSYSQMIQAGYLEPNLGFILVSDERTAFKINIGYTIHSFGFWPYMIGLKTNGGYNPKNFSDPTTSLVFGFVYVHYFRMR